MEREGQGYPYWPHDMMMMMMIYKEESSLEKAKYESRPTITTWHLISPVLPRKRRSAIGMKVLISTFQLSKGSSNAKNMDITGKPNAMKKETDHVKENYLKEIRRANCGQDHPADARSCVLYKKEKEIIEVTHLKNVPFLEARRIVGSYMGGSYASITRRVDRTNEDNKYRTLVEKLIHLEANDWPKFQEHLKKITLGRILPNTSSATSLECWGGEIQCCSPNKNSRSI